MATTHAAPSAAEAAPARELAPEGALGGLRRLALLCAVWFALFLANPGVLVEGGSAVLACLALAGWGLVARRPGRRAFLAEWGAATLGCILTTFWMHYVWWGTYLFVGPVPALYFAVGGLALRRLVRRAPLWLALPLAWCLADTLRYVVEPPFGFGWMRTGVFLNDDLWLAGSARVWGTGGLSFCLAAAAGGLAALVEARGRLSPATLRAVLPGFAPLAVAALVSALYPAPATAPGPRLLLVQPAIEQRRKMVSATRPELFEDCWLPTAEGLKREAAAGRAPDLVCWGESMLPMNVLDEGTLEAHDEGLRGLPWVDYDISRGWLESELRWEEEWVLGLLFGHDGGPDLLPEGTSFLAGAEVFRPHEGFLRRMNAVVLWDADGERAGVAGKVHLVPAAEHFAGFERFGIVRDVVQAVAGYLPDLLPEERARVLTLATRDGAEYRMGVTVCFDNSFEDPYTEPLRHGPVDFHLVASNEAWYESSFEMDQMIAFSRLVALGTGRSLVRCTNSGVTALVGPGGRVLERLRVDGVDRAVPGALAVDVPVVTGAGGASGRTVFVRTEGLWSLAWILPAVLLALTARKRPVTGA